MWKRSLAARYGYISINGKSWAAHRLSLSIKIGRFLTDKEKALHTCDNEGCVNPNHLFVGTQKDNVQDMIAKGRAKYSCGEDHGSSVLTVEKVIRARRLHLTGDWTWKELAEELDAPEGAIISAVFGLTWKHVKNPPCSRPRNWTKQPVLTNEQVLEISAKYIPYKYSTTMLAAEYNCCSTVIIRALNRTNPYHKIPLISKSAADDDDE